MLKALPTVSRLSKPQCINNAFRGLLCSWGGQPQLLGSFSDVLRLILDHPVWRPRGWKLGVGCRSAHYAQICITRQPWPQGRVKLRRHCLSQPDFTQNSVHGWEFHTGELEKAFGYTVPLVWITLSSEGSLVSSCQGGLGSLTPLAPNWAPPKVSEERLDCTRLSCSTMEPHRRELPSSAG